MIIVYLRHPINRFIIVVIYQAPDRFGDSLVTPGLPIGHWERIETVQTMHDTNHNFESSIKNLYV